LTEKQLPLMKPDRRKNLALAAAEIAAAVAVDSTGAAADAAAVEIAAAVVAVVTNETQVLGT
jgi:hypothetical protein